MPTIDPKKIEEWKRRSERYQVNAHGPRSDPEEERQRRAHPAYLGPDYLYQHVDAWKDAAADEAVPSLLAEREEMLAVLREVEWKGVGGDSEVGFWPACPCCGRGRDVGHAAGCRLAASIR